MDYHGYRAGSLENEFLRLDYLLDAGPRIVRLFLGDSPVNLLAEVPDAVTSTEFGDYHFLGGHRLWHAPESLPRTYIPDDRNLVVEKHDGGVRLTQPVEGPTGIRKSIEIRLDTKRASIQVLHTLENAGLWAVELAPWTITQLRLGGMAVIPQHSSGVASEGLLPDRILVFWPYTRSKDPRLITGDDFHFVEGNPLQPPIKIGTYNQRGWSGYLLPGVFFVKRFPVIPDARHVDFGCNNEVFVNDRFIELETLGPLARLEPGHSVSHLETWELTGRLDYPLTPDGARTLVRDLDLP